MDTEGRIVKILYALEDEGLLKVSLDLKNINGDTLILDIGLNSISFIQFIVGLEEEFNIEFEDAMLDYKKIKKIKQLCYYINKMLVEAN